MIHCWLGLHKWHMPTPTKDDLRFIESVLALGLPVATHMQCERCGAWRV